MSSNTLKFISIIRFKETRAVRAARGAPAPAALTLTWMFLSLALGLAIVLNQGYLSAASVDATESPAGPQSKGTQSDQFYFDADRTEFFSGGQKKRLIGEVLALREDALILADEILYEPPYLTATGTVLGVLEDNVFRAESLTFHTGTTELSISQVLLIIQDPKLKREYIYKALGLSPEEREFERQRKEKLAGLRAQQQRLLQSLRVLHRDSSQLKEDHSGDDPEMSWSEPHRELRSRVQKNYSFFSLTSVLFVIKKIPSGRSAPFKNGKGTRGGENIGNHSLPKSPRRC